MLAQICEEFKKQLPEITSRFINHADLLRQIIEVVTLKFVDDVKNVVQDDKSKNAQKINPA